MLEGGIDGRPDNVLFYATSNRRHLMPRDMIENERSTAIHPGEAVEEKVSLSDRFGLWLGFHPCSQDDYLAMVDGYVRHFGLARRARPAAARGAGVGADPRRPLGPGRLAVRAGSGRRDKAPEGGAAWAAALAPLAAYWLLATAVGSLTRRVCGSIGVRPLRSSKCSSAGSPRRCRRPGRSPGRARPPSPTSTSSVALCA